MLRRLGVRGKVLATLAMPILVLALAAGWVSWTSLQSSTVARQTSQLVGSLAEQDSAGSAFAAERSLNIAASMGVPGATDGLAAAVKQTDAALDARAAAFAKADTSALDPRVRAAVAKTVGDRDRINQLQQQVLARTISEQEATTAYSGFIEDALDVVRELAGTTTDRDLAVRLEAYVQTDEAMLSVVLERPLVGAVLVGAATGQVNQTLVLRTASTLADTNKQLAQAQQQLDALPGAHQLPALDGPLGDVRNALSRGDFGAVDPAVAAKWNDLTQTWVTSAQPIRDSVRDEIRDYAESASTTARNTALLTAGVAFGVLLISIVIALLVSRRIVVPLRRLTEATGEIRDRLPRMVEQMAVPGQTSTVDLFEIPVDSRDEIGRLAQSFNDVNATTVAVAREQAALRGSIAEMFVNVARRDQVLLNRQLAFLDDLERSEEDPSTLSNLFRLDHLATRMRRNAESLLVLAGIDSGRRVRQPMPVSDVVRTASSEIELYDRVRLNLDVDPLMLGHNALNAAHLVAELLENATMFSEPHTPVEVTTSRDARGVIVTVRDHGLGMTPEELADANEKVVSRSAQDAVGAQRLGLYVVGRLADRLGVAVVFAHGPDGTGTVVTVVFPGALFLPDDAVPLPQPTDPLEASTQREAASLGQAVAPATAFGQVASAAFGSPAVEPHAALAPHPVSEPVATYQSTPTPLVEPEPPLAVPVDLGALTDGTTPTGMPRRRTARQEPERAVEVVLPPLATPDIVPDLSADEWAPPQGIEAGHATLPSRSRVEAPAAPAEPAEVTSPVLAVEQRTGLFSSFRSLSELDQTTATGTLHLGASVEDPAALPAPLLDAPAPQTETYVPVSESTAQLVRVDLNPPVAAPVADPAAFVTPLAPPAVPEPAYTPAPFGTAPVTPPAIAEVPLEAPPAAEADVPAFDELMADLPTRRSTREQHAQAAAARKRGLFGRRPEDEASTSAIPVQLADGPAAASFVAPAPAAPLPAFDGRPDYAVPAPAAPVAPAPAPAAPAPAPAAPAPIGLRVSSALPLRSTAPDPLGDPLDPYAIPDTVEARSEWMASAVLYEEMSSLLRRGVFEEKGVTPTHDDDTYRPTSAAPAQPSGLARRGTAPTVNPATDRFTARIERDPEQLRSRLSAFQSATSRGRVVSNDEGPSTWAPAP